MSIETPTIQRVRNGESLLVAHPDNNVPPGEIWAAAQSAEVKAGSIEVMSTLVAMSMVLTVATGSPLSGVAALATYTGAVVLPPLLFLVMLPWCLRFSARDVLNRVDFEIAVEVPLSYSEFEWEVGHFNRQWGRESKARAAYLARAWDVAQRVADGSWEPATDAVSSCVLPESPVA